MSESFSLKAYMAYQYKIFSMQPYQFSSQKRKGPGGGGGGSISAYYNIITTEIIPHQHVATAVNFH
jgi:hypothetical protein